MRNRLAYLSFILAAASLLEAAPALAQPEVRDHRSEGGGPGPSVQQSQPRYRRRPGPRIMMPLKIDIGAATTHTVRGFAPGVAAAVGIHWASLSPNPTQTDIGIGLFGAVHSTPKDDTIMDDKNAVAYGGAYLELAHTLSHGNWWRTWASGRGEYLASTAFGMDHVGFGASGRLSAELFVSGVGLEPRGVFLGSYAIGVYVEAGIRDQVVDVGKVQASLGLTFRTPLVFAF